MYKCKYSRLRVMWNIRKMARKLKAEKLVKDDTVFLVMITGGVWFASKLFDCLGNLPNEVFYIKAHSYNGTQRGEFVWDLMPKIDLSNRNVILLDDICDSGVTLKAAGEYLLPRTKSLMAVTLLQRLPCYTDIHLPLYACIQDHSTDFFVGCGLDCNGHGRLLQHICTY